MVGTVQRIRSPCRAPCSFHSGFWRPFQGGKISFYSRMSTFSTDLDRTCGDSSSQSTCCISDHDSDDQSVDFGTLVSDRETPKSQCFGYANADDSVQECYFTEKTRHYASQTTYSNQTSRKKRQRSLEHLEPERDSSSSSFNLQDLEDREFPDLHNGKHLYAGREIFSRYILQFVRNASMCCVAIISVLHHLLLFEILV